MRRCLGLLAALALALAACAPRVAVIEDPSTALSSPARVSPEERRASEEELKRSPASPKAARALYFVGLALFQEGRWAEAGEAWQNVVTGHAGSGWDRAAQLGVAQSLEALGDPARAFVQYQNVLQGAPLADAHAQARQALERLAAGGLDLTQTARVLALPPLPDFEPRLRLRLIQLKAAALDSEGARAGIEDFLRRYPQGPFLEQVESISAALEEGVQVDARCLGLFVPATGPLAPFAAKVRQGVELALEQANAALPEAQRLRLVLADEAGSTTAAVAALRELLAKEKPVGLIGPLSSDAALAVAPYLSAWRLPLISPSAARGDLAGLSPWFFRNCLTPEMQGTAMADHALLELKLTRVAALHPDSAYGRSLAAAFLSRTTELGGVAAASVSYSAGARDFHAAMLALGGIDPSAAKEAEADERRAQQAEVENASTALGRVLLQARGERALEALSPTAAVPLSGAAAATPRPPFAGGVPLGSTVTPRLRLALVDFACDSAAAQVNAGRAFSERFRGVLNQLEELEVLAPEAAARWLSERRQTPESVGLAGVAELGRDLGVDFVLGGGIAEIDADWAYLSATAQGQGPEARQARADLERFRRNRVFELAAQVVDARAGTVAATRRFQFTKYLPPPANPLGIQAIFLPAPAEEVALVAPNLAFFELHLPLLGSDAWDKPALLRSGADLEGARYCSGFSEAGGPDSPAGRFAAAYRARYAERPGVFAAQAYDAAGMLIQALSLGAGNRAALRAALAATRDFEGVSGLTSFAERQDAVKRPPILVVKDGEAVLLK